MHTHTSTHTHIHTEAKQQQNKKENRFKTDDLACGASLAMRIRILVAQRTLPELEPGPDRGWGIFHRQLRCLHEAERARKWERDAVSAQHPSPFFPPSILRILFVCVPNFRSTFSQQLWPCVRVRALWYFATRAGGFGSGELPTDWCLIINTSPDVHLMSKWLAF